jgi:hypothetical protein
MNSPALVEKGVTPVTGVTIILDQSLAPVTLGVTAPVTPPGFCEEM